MNTKLIIACLFAASLCGCMEEMVKPDEKPKGAAIATPAATKPDNGIHYVDDVWFPVSKTAAAAPSGSMSSGKQFHVERGSFLSETLKKWADDAGWQFVWEVPAEDDFRMEAENNYGNDFKSAVIALFQSMPSNVHLRPDFGTQNIPPLLYVTRTEGKS